MKIWVTIFMTAMVLTTSVEAYEVPQALYDELGIDALVQSLPDEFYEILEGFSFFGGGDLGGIITRITNYICCGFLDELKSICTPALHTLKIIMICVVLSALFSDDYFEAPIRIFGGTAIIYSSLWGGNSFTALCVSALRQLYNFSTVLLPCLAGASVVSGATVSAGVKYTAAALFMNGLLHICVNVLGPIIAVYLVAMIGGILFEQRLLCVVAKWLKWCSMTLLTGSMALFVAYINVAGLISSAGDMFATRLTKTALSAGLPVVGKIISDTASTLVAGASVLRNCIGVYGVLAVMCILLIPLLSIGMRYLLFKVISEVSELFPNKYFSELCRGIAGAFGMLVGVLGAGFIFIFMTMISFMQVTVG